MAESSIPVDLFNPGQVLACLGFLEAADVLLGDAEGGFDWSDEADVRFYLRADGDETPFEAVLQFLARAEVKTVVPEDWRPREMLEKKKDELEQKLAKLAQEKPEDSKAKKALKKKKGELERKLSAQEKSEVFPSVSPETSSALPIQIASSKTRVGLGHWADGSRRNDFKLYAGNRSAFSIATEMRKGIARLWKEKKDGLIKRPFDVPRPMRGSFNLDPRGGWTAIDAGYSPNDQKHKVAASPVVELLAAWGLENARPNEYETRKVRYSVWGVPLPPILARAALFGGIAVIPTRRFRFALRLSGKNKIVTFAEQEI